MSVLAVEPTIRCAIPPEPVLPLTVQQYHEMARAGIFVDGDPIELLEGWLVQKMTKHPRHRAATRRVRLAIEKLLSDAWSVDVQEPITTGDSEPEPDVSVVFGDTAEMRDRHPAPSEVGLVVEVADSSLERDRVWKKRIYAAAGIPTYWIVNLIENCVEVFTQPSGANGNSGYAKAEVWQRGDEVPVVLDGREFGRVAVNDLLP